VRVFEQAAYLIVRAKTREEADAAIQRVVPELLRAHANADSGVDLAISDTPLVDVTEEYDG
jgi:hypothetical protein